MTFRAVNVMVIFLVGCGCAVSYDARDAAAQKSNERSVADAIARAGWTSLTPETVPRTNDPRVVEPTVVDSAELGLPPGKFALVFPSSSEPPLLVRDKNGKVLHIIEVKHEVKETRSGRVCGCGPYAGGGAPPPTPPSWWVPVDSKDAWGGDVTIVARGWIDLAYTYPEANDRGCREIP